MKTSVEQFLEQTARKGSWYGGGSAAALGCALAAALLEKLARQASLSRELRTIRRRCAALIERDATTFARVIRAASSGDRRGFARRLNAAIKIPEDVHRCSRRLVHIARRIRATISPRYRVDLDCAVALANASGTAARALVITNLAWLGERAYSRRIRQQLARLT